MEKNPFQYIPLGSTHDDIKVRERIIKEFYAKWCAEHPDKKIYNNNLGKEICVKFISINETYSKAARSYASTIAVLKLTEILMDSVLVGEKAVKKGVQNQKSFEKMLLMMLYGNIKMTVGVQSSTGDLVQYCITVIK